MAWEAENFRGERHETARPDIARIEPRGADALRIDALAVPPLHAAREPIDFRQVKPERLADIAQCTARAIADDGGRQRGAFAAVLAVDVLNDLLAPLMLEIDVDIRRLVALLGNEPLEQHGHARGIDFRDLQAIADDGIRGRAAALTEDALRAGILNDIVHGEEKGLELELGDQAQLVLETLAHGGRGALRPALGAARPGQGAQMAGRGLARGNDLLGILVAQLLEVERAALGDRERLLEERRGIELAQALEGPQAALAVRKQANARLVQRNSQPNGREHILQGAAAAAMHVHVAGSDPRQLERRAKRLRSARRLASEPPVKSSTPSQRRPAKRSRSQRPSAAWRGSSAPPVCGSQMIKHPSSAFSRSRRSRT